MTERKKKWYSVFMSTIHIPEEKNNYTYILLCADGSFYCGWTNNLVRRLHAHNAGIGAKYTRSRLPVELVWYAISDTKEEAMSLEARIKHLTRRQKEKLVRGEADPFYLP